MNSRSILAALALWTVTFAMLAEAQAEQGPSVRRYRFLPQHSSFVASRPWLEAPDVQLRVFGTFEVRFTPGAGQPWGGNGAEFLNVNAWAYNPLTAAAPIDLDKALNLSGLRGFQLPVLAPFDRYEFEGKNADGSAVDLFASVIGRRFLLDGGTTPPADGKNHVVYELQSEALERPFADFNDDAKVDGADLATWFSGAGTSVSGDVDSALVGDADGDYAVDGADFLTWQRQLSEPARAAAVPEPATFSLAIACTLTAMAVRRHARNARG
jgi:hypothetical protein